MEDHRLPDAWASRGEATSHQLRRFSVHGDDAAAAVDGSDEGNGAAIRTTSGRSGSSVSCPNLVVPASPRDVFAQSSDKAMVRHYASSPTRDGIGGAQGPSLRTLNEGLASLEREILSARRRPTPSSASGNRLSSAPVSRHGLPGPPSRLQPLVLDEAARGPPGTGAVGPVDTPAPTTVAILLDAVLEAPARSPARELRASPFDRLNATTGDIPLWALPVVPPRSVTPLPPERDAEGPPRTEMRIGQPPLSRSRSRSRSKLSDDSPLLRSGNADDSHAQDHSSEAPQQAPGNAPPQKTRDGRIKVVVRKRPLNAGEAGVDCVRVTNPRLVVSATKHRIDLSEYTEESEYAFDATLHERISNQEVYECCAQELLDVTLQGGSASVFAYGQTGSGKTYTMMGASGDTGELGIYLLGVADLATRLSATQSMVVSFYEIYCNSLFDLLNSRAPVVLREDGNRKVHVRGLSWHAIDSAEELREMVKAGLEQRRTGCTGANEHSSRSHAILSIRVMDSSAKDGFEGTLNFVDLAGSERGADTATNDRLTRIEGAEINKSLLALKECIRALDEKKRHVPFRGSRLTEVLRGTFTGNSRTVMIANISPSSLNYEHSSNTLRYAFRVQGLSVAQVVPSKARNAPRPFQLGAPAAGRGRRSTSAAAPTGTRDLSRGDWKEPASDAEGGASPDAKRRRSSLARSNRQVRSRSNGKRHSNSSSVNKRNRSPGAGLGGGEISLADGEARAAPRPTRAVPPRPGSPLLPCRGSAEDSASPLGPAEAPPLGSARSGSSAALSSSLPDIARPPGIFKRRESLPVTQAPEQVSRLLSTEGEVMVSRELLREMEELIRAKVMRQLQRDLGSDIQEILDDKDAIIASLRSENAHLRRAARARETVCEDGKGGDQRLTSGTLGIHETQRPTDLSWLDI